MAHASAFKQLARAKWRSSGLTDAEAKELGLKALSAEQVKKKNQRFHEAGALFIPYWTLDGKLSRFYRIRYLEKLPGIAGLIEKPQRYDQLPVLQEVYYPNLIDWDTIAKDTSLPIGITEGELKAACACATGFPVLALGGVHSFMSSKRGISFLPSLEKIEWRQRTVFVVYDNDITHKLPVMRAQLDLARELVARGARVQFVSIPPGPEKGLDDFIVKQGKEAFSELLIKATPFEESEALWSMNEEVVLIRNVDVVLERSTGLLMFPDQYMRHLYANRFYMRQIEKGSGNKKYMVLEKTPIAPAWVAWEQRAELQELTYSPGSAQVIDNRSWNTWPGWGVVPVKGDIAPWYWLLDFLFTNDRKAKRYFEQWCAYPIQHPGAKIYTACVLWSRVKRLGKSMIGLALKYIYGENGVVVGPKQLKGDFNSWAKNRQLVIGEEITAGEAKIDADYLKYIITNPTVTINEKNKPEYTHPNHANYLFLSNHPDALFLEDGDERYMIHGIQQNSPGPREKYEWCNDWLHGTGPSHLMDYLLHLNLKDFNPREHAPKTQSKFAMIVAGKTDTGLWVLRLQEDPKHALRALGQKASESCDLYTAEQLYHAFDPQDRGRGRASVGSLGRQLIATGFRQVNGGLALSTASGIHRLYAVRNQQIWDQSTRKELRDHYDTYFGPKSSGGVK